MLTATKSRVVSGTVTTAEPRLLLFGVTLLLAASVIAGCSNQRAGRTAPSLELYVSDGMPAQHLIALDPATLADQGRPAGIDLDINATWTLSANGSTLVEIERNWATCQAVPSGAETIVVRDALTGATRTCIRVPDLVSFPRLSRDGSRLVVSAGRYPPQLEIFDTVHAQLLATVPMAEPSGWQPTLLDSDARRLYLVETTGPVVDQRPSPLQIIAYDLTTGGETGRLKLPDVLAGSWQTGRTTNGEPIGRMLFPAAALSPDGGRLAIIRADADTVTLIDAKRLTVQRTLALTRRVSLVQRLLHLLPLLPEEAEAKGMEGVSRQATFGSDGRLYLFGIEATVDATGLPPFRGLGLQVVDLDHGEILANALTGMQIDSVLPAPDGDGVYVFGQASSEGTSRQQREVSYVLQRLDAATLALQARRQFPNYRQIALGPTLPGTKSRTASSEKRK